MRLLIVSPYFPPQPGAASVRVWSLAQEAVNAGIQTDVLTVTKYEDQISDWSATTDAKVHEIQGHPPAMLTRFRQTGSVGHQPKGSRIGRQISAIRSRTGVFASVRMPDLTDYWVKPAVEWARDTYARDGQWDVVLSSSGPYTAHLVAMQIKRAHMARSWVTDFRDLWTANHAYQGLFPYTVYERRLEREVLAQTDAISTVSKPLAQWLGKRLGNRSPAPVWVIFNGYGERAPSGSTPPANHSWAPDRPIRLAYTGQLYPNFQNACPLLNAIARLRATGTDIKLTVAGASTESWAKLARSAGLRIGDDQGLELLGEISHQQAIELQRRSSALVGFEWNDPKAGVLTNKLFEYIAAGPLIVLTGPSGPMHELVKRTGRGIHLGDHADGIEQSIRGLIEGKQPFPTIVESEVESLSREHQSSRLIDRIIDLNRGLNR
ncbi:MAG: glycosyltransferase [Phycisphaerales bacterium]|nr:glycosyltransferase [Phycisphaerales bacterium]